MNNHLLEVTPPDILALDDGISVLILGHPGWLPNLKDFVNKTFIHSPVVLFTVTKVYAVIMYIGLCIKTK